MNSILDHLEKLTENAKKVLADSYDVALEYGNMEVEAEHLFIAIMNQKTSLATKLLASVGVDVEKTLDSITSREKSKSPYAENVQSTIVVSGVVKRVITDAFYLAHNLEHVYVGTEHILLALLKQKDLEFIKELESAGLSFEFMQDKLINFGTYAPGVFMKNNQVEVEDKEISTMFGRDLTQLSREGKLMPVIGRDKEVQRLIHILARRNKNNPILIGEAGVGKTAIVERFVQKIVEGDVPEFLLDFQVIQIDVASIIAGSKVRGDVEEKLLAIVEEVTSSANKILFIDEIHMIVGAGTAGSGSMDIANTLKPYLTDSNVRIIGATTNSEYQKYFEEDAALSRRFQPLRVEQISEDATLKILYGLRHMYESFHNVKITDEAIDLSVSLSSRYIPERFLPDKAIDVLDEAAASVKISNGRSVADLEGQRKKLDHLMHEKSEAVINGLFEKALEIQKKEKKIQDSISDISKKKRGKRKLVTAEQVKKVISEWSGIPVNTISASDLRALKGIDKRLEKKILGQPEALKRVASALKRARIGIGEEHRPLASFMFLGPTGVGKTEMAKAIAEEVFGSEEALIQVDMSEYMEQHSISKMIGSPPGYVGHQEGGQLTEKIRRKPYSIVLFDEIEKAHPELINILLQVLDEGRLTDSKGREVNFKNTIVAMTSNIGAEEIANDKTLGFNVNLDSNSKGNEEAAYMKLREQLLNEAKATMPPEFLNRLDDIIIFRGLDMDDARAITSRLLDELVQRLFIKGINFTYTQSAVNFVAENGFNEEYGARNIKRKIQELIETPIADLYLASTGHLNKVQVTKPTISDSLVFKTSKDKLKSK